MAGWNKPLILSTALKRTEAATLSSDGPSLEGSLAVARLHRSLSVFKVFQRLRNLRQGVLQVSPRNQQPLGAILLAGDEYETGLAFGKFECQLFSVFFLAGEGPQPG